MDSLQQETVVLVHGLAGSRLDMTLVARHLRKLGFHVVNWGYWSLNTNIQTHASRLSAKLNELEQADSVSRIHLVGHSMGGIVIRAMLAGYPTGEPLTKLSRVLMLASPNRGSHVATRLTPWLGWLTPSLSELSDKPESYVNQLPNSLKEHGLEFGVVEASKDRVIRPECVQLDGQSDFARVEGHHGVLTWYPETAQLIERFLLTGSFSKGQAADQRDSLANCKNNALPV
jgi:pimeloyl-ACP methyl ester carboxylesterase